MCLLLAMVNPAFTAYCDAPSATVFSSAHIGSLCFGDLPSLRLPEQLPPGALIRFDFYPTVPDSVRSTTLSPDDWVPSQEDLKPVLLALPQAFESGSRSVVLKIKRATSARPEVLTCHFQKLQLFRNCNMYRQRIADCAALFDLVASDDFPLSAIETSRFASHRLTGRIHGLSTPMTWADLTVLLGENYVWDDVIDARGELVQAKLARAAYPLDPDCITRIWAPSSLLLSAIELYSHQPRAYDQSLLALRDLVRTRRVTELFIIQIVDAHASTYHWTGAQTLGFGDSLGHAPLAGVLDAVNWILSGLDVPQVTGYHRMEVPRQPDDSGSCVIACCNTVERMLGTTSDVWSHELSPAFRGRILLDFIEWSNLFDDDLPVDKAHYELRPSTTLGPAAASFTAQKALDLWDVRWPKESHPAVRQGYRDIPLSRLEYLCSNLSLTPAPIGQFLIDPMGVTEPAALLPALSLHDRDQVRAPDSLHGSADPFPVKQEPPEYQPMPGAPLSRVHMSWSPSSDASIKIEPIEGTIPSTPPSQATSQFIDLTLSSPELKSTPPKRPSATVKHKASPLARPAVKRRKHRTAVRAASIISISSDSDTSNAPEIKRKLGAPQSFAIPAVKEEPASSATAVKVEAAEDAPVSPGVGATFLSLEVAVQCVYAAQNRLGFKWRLAQSRQGSDGEKKKQVLRCVAAGTHVPQHLASIDPADHRQSKTIRTGCGAHVNINRSAVTGLWTITTAIYAHNHDCTIPPGATATRPATQEQRKLIKDYATDHTFSRRHIGQILERAFPDNHLEARQVTNIINASRSTARSEIIQLGGDFRAVQARLDEYKRSDPNWTYFIMVGDDGKVTGLFWQSPEQVRLAQTFGDVLLNDNTYNRNVYQYSLNIGVIIDGSGRSRNVWYALQEREDIASHSWVLDCYLISTGNAPPDIFFSDRHASVIAAVEHRMPTSAHFFCLNHLNGNLTENLVSCLGLQWKDFTSAFWKVYWAPSPEDFDRAWAHLLAVFPAARPYLHEHIYPIRHQWAWAWLSLRFTAGTRTTGRVEVENRVNKTFTGPKVTVLQMFDQLNFRTKGQSARETEALRQSSRVHHDTNLEHHFRLPLGLIRAHVRQFATQKSYEQMKDSMFYTVKALRLPDTARRWTANILAGTGEQDTEGRSGTETASTDPFAADGVSLSTRYILEQLASQNLPVQQLLLVTHTATGAAHTIAVIDHQRHVCDCAMLTNLGVPCRHFYAAWQRVQGMMFHIALINRRWFTNRALDVSAIAPVTMTHAVPERRLAFPADELSARLSNPLGAFRATPAPATATLGSRTVYHEAHAAFKPLLERIQTQEQLDGLLGILRSAAKEQEAAINPPPPFHDPPPVVKKGRPRVARIPAAREAGSRTYHTRRQPPSDRYVAAISAEQQASSPQARSPSVTPPPPVVNKGRKCGLCGRPGHNRTTCTSTDAL